MLFNTLMEGETIATNNILSSIKNFSTEEKEHGTIKALLKNFILPESDMAIKQKQSFSEKCVYTVPIKPPMSPSYQRKSVNEAKQAFLNSTLRQPKENRQEPTLHYAQIAISTESDDTRSTGGGKVTRETGNNINKEKALPIDIPSSMKKRIEQQQQRRVSFKIKNASALHRRPPHVTTMTITSSKVSELTKKFNDLVYTGSSGSLKQSKLVKTFEDLQSACSASNSSTPSSTLSSSPNIKIVVRHRRGSKKRNSRKRCSSVDSVDKLILSDNANSKVRVIRSKSDGNKIPKSPKKKLKYPDSNGPSGSDSVDGSPSKLKSNGPKLKEPQKESSDVKSVIKKFEYEISAQSNQTNTFSRQQNQGVKVSTISIKEKPKIPEKKSSLVVTKNLVLKDGVPKIKTLKPVPVDLSSKQQTDTKILQTESIKRKEPIYDKKKFKTNYIHSEKLPLHVVEIIQEEVTETTSIIAEKDEISNTSQIPLEDKTLYQDIENQITPNESFLWRRKSNQMYSDCEKSSSESPYGSVSVIVNESHITCFSEDKQNISNQKDESQITYAPESQASEGGNNLDCESASDFESNLIEAYNREVLVGFTSKPRKEVEVEDDYEPLEPRDENIVVLTVKNDRTSKINCPLPEIPKTEEVAPTENIYQCLLEMRSHPEGDESSLHNYETCGNQLEERTRGDGDSDDGYEYCKSPVKPYCHTSSSGIQIAENYNPYVANKNYSITKSVSGASTVSYEKIGSDRIYEKIPSRPSKSKENSPKSKRDSIISDYNDENIYDTIKHADGVSLSHCYESIPNSPSMMKLSSNVKKNLSSAVQKRLSFDTVSNISQSTVSSEQKTNSIYGQRSVLSYNGQEIVFQVPSSETSVSDRSDRSDDWVDISDEEKTEEKKIIIVQERSRGKKGLAWSQKVRHQWQNSPKQNNKDKVSVSSPTKLYIETNEKCPYYSRNDEKTVPVTDLDEVKFIEVQQQTSWLDLRTILQHEEIETQDLVAFIDCDSSDSGHLYESLEPAPEPPSAPRPVRPSPPPPIDEDFDSFDSDTDDDDHDRTLQAQSPPDLPASRLPTPPHGGQYTLTKIASAAQKKMRQIKRNLTKRYSVAMDGKTFIKSSNQSCTYDVPKNQTNSKSSIYSNDQKPDVQHLYSNINFDKKTDKPLPKITGTFKDELKTVMDKKDKIGEKRLSGGEIPPPLPEKPPPEKPTTPPESKKDSGTLSRKAYFSFKSRFRRATSMAVDINAEVPSALKITNSTFYLTDSMDGDSGFSNCSDSGATNPEALSPTNRSRRDGTRLRPAWSESSPCLALERPTLPPPPPPQHTDLSAVNEELKRLLPTLSRKEKAPRTRTSWYAEYGPETAPAQTSNSSWYAEAGLYPAGNISSSSGASSGSHPASPLPHSLFTHEPLYQFYNAAKVESACREGDSDSDAYEAGGSTCSASRPSAMALVAPRGPARTLWCEVPEVLNSAVLSSLAPAQKKLQEAKFELLTSEASYLNSLNVLEAHFISHPAFREANVLAREDWETLFSTILPVRKCSQMLLADMERCWQENILLAGICDIVRSHAEQRFHAYVKYCENQALMVRALQRLRGSPQFAATLKQVESHPACQSLSLHSFLMLPMQRITRLPLLLDAVLRNLAAGDDEYDGCMHALATLNNFVSQCNEGARSTERLEEMFRLSAALRFPAALRRAPDLAPACDRRDRKPVRWLVRSGELTQLVWKTDELKLTFGKKFHKVPLHLFLFNDHLVITKKKSEDCYVAVDHCPRSLVDVCSSDAAASAKHALLITLLENHEGRTVEMLMSCASETDARRWSEALAPPGCGGGGAGGADGAGGGAGEAVYAGWDCPQVAALYAYGAAQPDELCLAEGDIVNVTRKTSEGWYYGERTRDGEAGWFPGSYTVEIASPHVRARNLRQRYRLLALSGTYLGQKKRP